jgi:hypothetical protein
MFPAGTVPDLYCTRSGRKNKEKKVGRIVDRVIAENLEALRELAQ